MTTAQIQALATSLQRLTSRPDTLRRFGDAMTDYARRVRTSTLPTTAGTPPASARVAAALWKVQARAFLRQAETTETAIVEQYVVEA